jgi:hypothetical protein
MTAGAPGDAIPLLQQSAELARAVGYRRGEAIALRNLGRSQLRTGQSAAAESTLRSAVAVFEGLREQAGAVDAYNISLLDAQRDAYRSLQAALIAENKPEAALEISERGRARALTDLLVERGATPGPTVAPGIDAIRAVARSRQGTLVEFSIVEQADEAESSAIYIWVVRPDGTVLFRRVSVASHGGSLDSALEGLVHDTRATLGALGRREVPSAKPGIAGRDEMLADRGPARPGRSAACAVARIARCAFHRDTGARRGPFERK